MPAGDGGMDGKLHELCAQAQAARRQSRLLAARHRAAQHDTAEILQLIHAAQDRAEQIHEQWLTASTERLRYSEYARLQARLASMPLIERAKGIIMARCGWPEEQAFDALRQLSQRKNIKVRDLAAWIVADTARPPDPPQAHHLSAKSQKLRP